MATPVRRTDAPVPPAPIDPIPVLAPLGWVLILAAGAGLVLASWLLYPIDYDGMWAGYRDGFIGTVVILCALTLNTRFPRQPVLAICGLAGILLVLFGIFIDSSHDVFVTELTTGIVLLVGVACQMAA